MTLKDLRDRYQQLEQRAGADCFLDMLLESMREYDPSNPKTIRDFCIDRMEQMYESSLQLRRNHGY